ncbi:MULTISPECIES: hypothetical protein [Rhizobium/Agrobacterium group]|uniref:Uncharacterized protein n=1 Tax=Agrobacterium tumefaciens TaxID=358 RepID=K7WMZ1_AGRTU|nr:MULTISPECIES: hypothetical protein [Rhizobium/Agrobacterium group]AFX65570.1 Hypothetical protein [Agrobacterium radiobacter]NTI38969.1 hypothetical protein [Rhizobium rhizogenes]WEO70015.1 hypothetical protein G6L54_033415 [Rhizobium rhizogenes]
MISHNRYHAAKGALVIESLPPPLIVPVSRLYRLTPEIQERLRTSQVYFIMRRPRLSLVASSIRLKDGCVLATIRAQVKDSFQEFDTFLPLPNHPAFRSSRVRRVWAEEDYPSYQIFIERNDPDGGNWELDLADFLMWKEVQRPEFEHFHVDYIGHSLGKDGLKGAVDRLVGRHGHRYSHEHLQEIVVGLNSLHPDQEAFVALFSFEGDQETSERNYANFEGMTLRGPHADQISQLPRDQARSTRIQLAEAALIRYFRPKFNDKYKNTFPSKSHSILKPLRDMEIKTLVVRAATFRVGAVLYSEGIMPSFDHRAEFELPGRR